MISDGLDESDKCIFYSFKEDELTNQPNQTKRRYKLLKLDFFMKNELTNIQPLIQIPHYKRHFYVIENSKELSFMELSEEAQYLCAGKTVADTNTVLLKYDSRELIYLKNYLKTLSSSKKYIYMMIEIYKALLKSVQLLVDSQVVHNHLSFDSLMVDALGNPVIANFAYSLNVRVRVRVRDAADNMEYIRPFFTEYDPTYLEWPLELHLLSYLLTNKLNSLSLLNIETVITDVIKHHSILNTFGSKFVSSFVEEAKKYFYKYINQSVAYIVTDIFRYFDTWDNYALSILYLRICIGIHRSIQVQNKFIILFMKLLVCNIHLDPSQRHSIVETTNKWNGLLDGLEPRDYLSLIRN